MGGWIFIGENMDCRRNVDGHLGQYGLRMKVLESDAFTLVIKAYSNLSFVCLGKYW